MIDIKTEEILTFHEACKRLPKRRRGRPVHIATIHRWGTTGLGGVVLETLQIGGGKVTSTEALQRFFEKLTVANDGVDRSAVGDESRDAAAAAELRRRGVCV